MGTQRPRVFQNEPSLQTQFFQHVEDLLDFDPLAIQHALLQTLPPGLGQRYFLPLEPFVTPVAGIAGERLDFRLVQLGKALVVATTGRGQPKTQGGSVGHTTQMQLLAKIIAFLCRFPTHVATGKSPNGRLFYPRIQHYLNTGRVNQDIFEGNQFLKTHPGLQPAPKSPGDRFNIRQLS